MNYPTDLNRIALYLRKSRADLEAEARGEGETLSKHRRALFEIAKKQRYAIDEVYEEIVSGERIVDRPEMQRLLHSVQEGKYNAVLCMDLDRLGRGNMVDQGLIQDAFKSSNTLIITPRKVYDLQDEMDEEWSEFEAFMARRELKIITRRMQRGRRQSAAEGKSISKKPPYGYLRDEHLKLYPDPEKGLIVRLIFEMIAEGHGARTVAKHLTDSGILAPAGGKDWDRSTIHAILYNPVYLGHIIWNRVSYQKSQSSGSKYDRRKTSEEEWIVHENAHEPLISGELFQAAHQMVKKNDPKIPKDAELANPLAGLLFCAKCGKAMRRQKTYNRPTTRIFCSNYNCDTKGATLEVVEQLVLQNLQDYLNSLRTAPKMNRQKSAKSEQMLLDRKIQTLQSALSDLKLQQENLFDLVERKVYDIETYLNRNRVVTERIESTKRELESAEKAKERLAIASQKQKNIIPQIKNVLQSYHKTSDVKRKNELLKDVIERIVYHREKDWNGKNQFELDVTLLD